MGRVVTEREEGWHQGSGQKSAFQRTAEVVAQLRLQKLRAGVLRDLGGIQTLLRPSRLPIYSTHLGTLSYLTYCVPSFYLFPHPIHLIHCAAPPTYSLDCNNLLFVHLEQRPCEPAASALTPPRHPRWIYRMNRARMTCELTKVLECQSTVFGAVRKLQGNIYTI